jgi:hypothetical protein
MCCQIIIAYHSNIVIVFNETSNSVNLLEEIVAEHLDHLTSCACSTLFLACVVNISGLIGFVLVVEIGVRNWNIVKLK